MDTARDWADEVKSFCEGKLKMSKYSFMKQDNVKQKIVAKDERSLSCIMVTNPNQLHDIVKQESCDIVYDFE